MRRQRRPRDRHTFVNHVERDHTLHVTHQTLQTFPSNLFCAQRNSKIQHTPTKQQKSSKGKISFLGGRASSRTSHRGAAARDYCARHVTRVSRLSAPHRREGESHRTRHAGAASRVQKGRVVPCTVSLLNSGAFPACSQRR